MMTQRSVSAVPQPRAVSGPGACCYESQADGVPCAELRECESCARAVPAELERTRAVLAGNTARV